MPPSNSVSVPGAVCLGCGGGSMGGGDTCRVAERQALSHFGTESAWNNEEEAWTLRMGLDGREKLYPNCGLVNKGLRAEVLDPLPRVTSDDSTRLHPVLGTRRPG